MQDEISTISDALNFLGCYPSELDMLRREIEAKFFSFVTVFSLEKDVIINENGMHLPTGSTIAVFIYDERLRNYVSNFKRDGSKFLFLLGIRELIESGKFIPLDVEKNAYLNEISETIDKLKLVGKLAYQSLLLACKCKKGRRNKILRGLEIKAKLLRIPKRALHAINVIKTCLGSDQTVMLADEGIFFEKEFDKYFPYHINGFLKKLLKMKRVTAFQLDAVIANDVIGVTYPWTIIISKELPDEEIKGFEKILKRNEKISEDDATSVEKLSKYSIRGALNRIINLTTIGWLIDKALEEVMSKISIKT